MGARPNTIDFMMSAGGTRGGWGLGVLSPTHFLSTHRGRDQLPARPRFIGYLPSGDEKNVPTERNMINRTRWKLVPPPKNLSSEMCQGEKGLSARPIPTNVSSQKSSITGCEACNVVMLLPVCWRWPLF